MMTELETTRASKFLSYVLRHHPEAAGLRLEEGGWVAVDRLLEGCFRANRPLTREQLDFVVENNAKKRFEFGETGTMIRASQGHSVSVDLQYEEKVPPGILYHGTATRFLESIRANGLRKMERHHVHLSDETKTTMKVGARHGKPVLLTIRALEMHGEGHRFFLSTNGVWLTDHVPPGYIDCDE